MIYSCSIWDIRIFFRLLHLYFFINKNSFYNTFILAHTNFLNGEFQGITYKRDFLIIIKEKHTIFLFNNPKANAINPQEMCEFACHPR